MSKIRSCETSMNTHKKLFDTSPHKIPVGKAFPSPVNEYPTSIASINNRNLPKGYDTLRYSEGVAPRKHFLFRDHILKAPPRNQLGVPTDQLYHGGVPTDQLHHGQTSINFHHMPLVNNANHERGNQFSHHYMPSYLYGRHQYMFDVGAERDHINPNMVKRTQFYPQRSMLFKQNKDYMTYPKKMEFIDGFPYYSGLKPLGNCFIESFVNRGSMMGNLYVVGLLILLVYLFSRKNV